jgi:hypothetical protein
MSDTDWPPELDALVAAPKQHRLLLENERVRVLDTEIAPGEKTPLHTHRWPAVHYIVSWADFVRRDAGGATLVDTRGREPAAGAVWGPALGPHTLENVGTGPIRVISVEIKA